MHNCYHLNRYPADHEIVGTEIALSTESKMSKGTERMSGSGALASFRRLERMAVPPIAEIQTGRQSRKGNQNEKNNICDRGGRMAAPRQADTTPFKARLRRATLCKCP